MRRPRYLSVLALGLAIAGPGQTAMSGELCNALVLMEAALTLPSGPRTDHVQKDKPRGETPMAQELIRKTHRALDKAEAQRVLPAGTIALYRQALSDGIGPHRSEPGADRLNAQIRRAWQRHCKTTRDRPAAHHEPRHAEFDRSHGSDTGSPRRTPRTSESVRTSTDVLSTVSELPAGSSWRGVATLLAAAAAALAAKTCVEMRGRRKRRARRFACDVPGCLATAAGMSPARVTDISRLGCLLRIDLGPPAKTRCRVWLHDRWLDGRVAWSNKCYAGIEFNRQQSREFIIEIVRGDQRMWPETPLAHARTRHQDA